MPPDSSEVRVAALAARAQAITNQQVPEGFRYQQFLHEALSAGVPEDEAYDLAGDRVLIQRYADELLERFDSSFDKLGEQGQAALLQAYVNGQWDHTRPHANAGGDVDVLRRDVAAALRDTLRSGDVDLGIPAANVPELRTVLAITVAQGDEDARAAQADADSFEIGDDLHPAASEEDRVQHTARRLEATAASEEGE